MRMNKILDPRYDTVSWECKSCHGGGIIPLSVNSCPNCGVAMPQEVRDRIYTEIRQELRYDAKRARCRRWRAFGSLCLTWWPVTLLVLLLLGVGIFWLVAPDAYQAIADSIGGIIHGAGETAGSILNGIGGFFQWLGRALRMVGRFLMVLLQGLWWVLMILWNILCRLVAWIWEFLVLVYENLPEILGWLWEALKWLWNFFGLLLGLLWELLQFFVQALPSLLSGLWQFLGMLLNALGELFALLWNIVKWAFSLIF